MEPAGPMSLVNVLTNPPPNYTYVKILQVAKDPLPFGSGSFELSEKSEKLGGFGDVDGGWTLRASLVDLEAYGVANCERLELNTNYLLLVKEEILLTSFDGDESKLLISKNSFDNSCHVCLFLCYFKRGLD